MATNPLDFQSWAKQQDLKKYARQVQRNNPWGTRVSGAPLAVPDVNAMMGDYNAYVDQLKRGDSISDLRAQSEQVFSPTNINPLFNTMLGNLARAQGGAVAGAQRTAGAQAYSGSALNPASMVQNAGQNARAAFVQPIQNTEAQRAQALQSALASKLGFQANLQSTSFNQDMASKQLELAREQFKAQLSQWEQSQPGFIDYLMSAAPTIARLLMGNP